MSTKHKKIDIKIQLEEGAAIPVYSSSDASGADVRAFLKSDFVLKSGATTLVPTGLRFAIPVGYEIQVRPRSGLALKHGITVLNAPGTIDADYRGELGVILINHSKEDFVIQPGMRIAQLVVSPIVQAQFESTQNLVDTPRGINGFGHTGTH